MELKETHQYRTSLAYGTVYPQFNILLLESFGMKHFGQNSSVVTLGRGIGNVLFQQLFAIVYDTYSPLGSTFCYGEECTRWYFGLVSIICFCIVVLILGLIKIEIDERQKHEEL